MKKINILIIDDHYLMIEGYKSILNTSDSSYEFAITAAHDCKSAYQIISNPAYADKFNLVFLDRSLPPYPEMKISNGDDLAKLIRRNFPTSKIVVLTSHAEAFVLYNIVKTIAPEGLLVKSDFTADDFIEAVHLVLADGIYHSQTVKINIKEMTSSNCYLDNYNRQIITLLSMGVKTKSIPDYLPLSLSAIDKRKVQIRDYFDIDKGGDEEIIRQARQNGLV